MTRRIILSRPESTRIGSKNFIDENQLPIRQLPKLKLRIRDDDPPRRGEVGGLRVQRKGATSQFFRQRFANSPSHFSKVDVDVMPGFFLRCRRKNWRREFVALLQTCGKFDAADGLGFLIFLPPRPGEIPAGDAFDRHHLRLLHEHRAISEWLRDVGPIRILDEMILKLLAKLVEPKHADGRENLALARDRRRYDA